MKIGPLPIILIGISIFLIAVSYGYFHHYSPVTQEIANKEAQVIALRNETRKLPQVEKRVADAEADVRKWGAQWQEVVARKAPPSMVATGGINISVNAYQLTVDSRRFRDSIQKAVNTQLKKGGVRIVNGLTVPEPTDDADQILSGYYNFPAIAFPVVIFDLGQTTVEGTYDQIMANVRSWADMPNYLAVADGLSITGTSPRLRGSYNVTLVGYIRGKVVGPPPVSPASAP
jgi:hypothetical protein